MAKHTIEQEGVSGRRLRLAGLLALAPTACFLVLELVWWRFPQTPRLSGAAGTVLVLTTAVAALALAFAHGVRLATRRSDLSFGATLFVAAPALVVLAAVLRPPPPPSLSWRLAPPHESAGIELQPRFLADGLSPENDILLAGDVDRDGDVDLIVGGKRGALLWFENLDGGWLRHEIESAPPSLEAGGVLHDIDRDGDLDLVAGRDFGGDALFWWRCPDDPRAPWDRRTILTMAGRFHDQAFGDVDRDGEAELVFWNQGEPGVFWLDIPADPTVTPWPDVRTIARPVDGEGIAIADVDGDGDQDVVAGPRWYEAGRDPGAPWRVHDIAPGWTHVRVATGDVDRDGRLDVVLSEAEQHPARIGLFRALDPRDAWTEERLQSHLFHVHSLEIGDADGDGHLDVFAAEMGLGDRNPGAKLLFYRGDGTGGFQQIVLSRGLGVHEARLVDLDGDGDLDILGKPYLGWADDRIVLFENLRRLPRLPLDRWRRVVVTTGKRWRSLFVLAADLDRDGYPDLVTGGDWFRNPRRPDGSWKRFALPEIGNVAAAFDVDGDGDLDLLGTRGRGSNDDPRLLWLENTQHGHGWVVRPDVPRGNGDFLQGVVVADLDPGGSEEIALSWHAGATPVQMLLIPEDPVERWRLRDLSAVSQCEGLSAADVDRDGDLDLVLGTSWLENAGADAPWPLHRMRPDGIVPDRNVAADVDGDGALDVVVGPEAISRPAEVVWLKAPEDPRRLWSAQTIGTAVGPMSLDAGDLDRDGDVDVVVGEHDTGNPSRARALLFENVHRGSRWTLHEIGRGDEHHDGTQLVDVDRDGDLDVASISWTAPGVVLLYVNDARRPDPSLLPEEMSVALQLAAVIASGVLLVLAGCLGAFRTGRTVS